MCLAQQLRRCLQGRVCLVGLGNVEYADDGAGVRLVEALAGKAAPSPGAKVQTQDSRLPHSAAEGEFGFWTLNFGLACLVAGTTPERFVGRIAQKGFDNLIFIDAVDFGGVPGSMILLNSEQMSSRFPQVSTHKVSLGLLAKWVEAHGTTQAWLLGVQPESLAPGTEMSSAVQTSLESLSAIMKTSREEALV